MTIQMTNTILRKMVRLIIIISLLCGTLLLIDACPRHDIEAVYGGYEYRYEVTEYLFAIDTARSFNLVGAGSVKVASSPKRFIYFFDDANCAVQWHYLLDENLFLSYKELAIREESETIYGVVAVNEAGDYRLFEMGTVVHKNNESHTMRFYKID